MTVGVAGGQFRQSNHMIGGYKCGTDKTIAHKRDR
jgi:hypothetical protein